MKYGGDSSESFDTDRTDVPVISVDHPGGITLASWSVQTGSAQDRFAEIRDDWWSATFGTFQRSVWKVNQTCTLVLDFSRIDWIDPLPLLSILITLKSLSSRTDSHVSVELGDEPHGSEKRGGFLKFLAQHGFVAELMSLKRKISIKYGDREYVHLETTQQAAATQKTTNEDGGKSIEALCKRLSSESFAMTYAESRCLTAKVVPVSILDESQDPDTTLQKAIDPWVQELRDYGLKPFFEGDPERVEDLIHKIRVLLTEMVTNAAEHAYLDAPGRRSSHLGVYARIRKGSSASTGSRVSEALKRENACCPTLNRFQRDEGNSWIEVFYLDDGRGLLADMDKWAHQADEALREKLARFKSQSNVLFEVSNHFFQQPLSRHNRNTRTAMTGLQHINLVLTDGQDFARVYTLGQWCGGHQPWSQHARAGDRNLAKQDRYKAYETSAGTGWHFCLGLEAPKAENDDKRFSDWLKIESAHIAHPCDVDTTYANWKIFDERDVGNGIGYIGWRAETFVGTQFLWLPGAVTKQHIYQWLSALAKHCKGTTGPLTWIIADLSREQAKTFASVLLKENASVGRANLLIYIVTYDWYFQALRSDADSMLYFVSDSTFSQETIATTASEIFSLLRTRDSQLFWKGLSTLKHDPIESALVDERVIWTRDADGKPRIILHGYLDLTQALVNPTRAAVAARALRRTWFLHARNAECVRADVLLDNILPREARRSLHTGPDRRSDQGTRRVVVSSVYVTGSTASRTKESGHEVIHLLRHTNFDPRDSQPPQESQFSSRFALNWIDSPIPLRPVPDNQLPYERIPGTPYIGRGGPKAIPVRRFKRREPGHPYFVDSIYKQNPKDMYEHFLSLGILKLGHWVYGAHHDLLTINLGLAIDRESLDHGPMLQWLCTELQTLKDGGAEFVVYSSHPVTEKMIQAIKRSASLDKKIRLPEHFIPIHFLGTHTQTAIRIPSLTYDRIRAFLADRQAPKKIILLDDGALTGKVQRELEQLVRNAGASDVIHLSLVTRTGLPLYRQYLVSDHVHRHRHYWRWDVPPLGNARTCPLCRALQIAKELTGTMWSSAAREELDSWHELWREQSIMSHWWRHGLSPEKLPEARPITFGKEWPKDNTPVERYPIPHETTTGLAATVTELIRITSYKEVGLRVAATPWPEDSKTPQAEWRRAQIEILICQTMLFFDDFDPQELDERFEMLFRVLLGADTDAANQSIERLACLTLLLTSETQAHKIMQSFRPEILVASNFPIHSLITIGILARRAGMSLRRLKDTLRNIGDDSRYAIIAGQLCAAYALSQREVSRGTKRAILTLVLLLGENDSCAHTGFLRRKTSRQIPVQSSSIAIDLGLAAQAVGAIDSTVLSGEHASAFDQGAYAQLLKDLASALQEFSDQDSEDDAITRVHERLFGDETSLSTQFRRTFLSTPKQIEEYLRFGISLEAWKQKLSNDKGKDWSKRWNHGDLLPVIRIKWVDVDARNERDADTVVFPPIARQMVWDFLLDVRHSLRPYESTNESARHDMVCRLTLCEQILVIEMRNLAGDQSSVPGRKLSASLVSRELLEERAVTSHQDGDEIVTIIHLPLVTGLVRESL